MEHILFARENTACKHKKTTNKSKKFLPVNPGNILRAKALEYTVASHSDLALQLVRETEFNICFPLAIFSNRVIYMLHCSMLPNIRKRKSVRVSDM